MAQYTSLDPLFAALADPTRRAIVARLGRGPASVSELAAPAGMALPSFMKHLRLLEDCGLVRSAKAGRVRTVWLVEAQLRPLEGWLDEQRRIWEQRTDQLEHLAIALEDRSKTK